MIIGETLRQRPIANPDLWKILDLELGKRDIEWKWIRGHSGDPLNEYADRLVNDEAVRVGNYPADVP